MRTVQEVVTLGGYVCTVSSVVLLEGYNPNTTNSSTHNLDECPQVYGRGLRPFINTAPLHKLAVIVSTAVRNRMTCDGPGASSARPSV